MQGAPPSLLQPEYAGPRDGVVAPPVATHGPAGGAGLGQRAGQGVALRVLDQSIDTSDATGRLLFNMLGAIGQFETELRAERQADGIARAKANGVAFGRKRALTEAEIAALREARARGTLIRELMARHGLSKATVYRYLVQGS